MFSEFDTSVFMTQQELADFLINNQTPEKLAQKTEYGDNVEFDNQQKVLLKYVYTKVVGTTFTTDPLYLKNIKVCDYLDIVPEDNPYDKMALAVYHKGHRIGYVKKELAHQFRLFDNWHGVVSDVTGGCGDKENIGINYILSIYMKKENIWSN